MYHISMNSENKFPNLENLFCREKRECVRKVLNVSCVVGLMCAFSALAQASTLNETGRVSAFSPTKGEVSDDSIHEDLEKLDQSIEELAKKDCSFSLEILSEHGDDSSIILGSYGDSQNKTDLEDIENDVIDQEKLVLSFCGELAEDVRLLESAVDGYDQARWRVLKGIRRICKRQEFTPEEYCDGIGGTFNEIQSKCDVLENKIGHFDQEIAKISRTALTLGREALEHLAGGEIGRGLSQNPHDLIQKINEAGIESCQLSRQIVEFGKDFVALMRELSVVDEKKQEVYESVYVSRDFRPQLVNEMHGLDTPKNKDDFLWAILVSVAMDRQIQKNIEAKYKVYTSKINSWRIEDMRSQLAETAWACILWLRAECAQNGDENLEEEQKYRLEKLFTSLRLRNATISEQRLSIEQIVQNLCRVVNRIHHAERKDCCDCAGQEELVKTSDSVKDKDLTSIRRGDVDEIFASGKSFPLSLLKLMGGVELFGCPLSEWGGIRVVQCSISNDGHDFTWGVSDEWNIWSSSKVFNIAFVNGYFCPMTTYSATKTFLQKHDQEVPRKSSNNHPDYKQFRGGTRLLYEGEEGKRPLTQERIQELHEHYVQSKVD